MKSTRETNAYGVEVAEGPSRLRGDSETQPTAITAGRQPPLQPIRKAGESIGPDCLRRPHRISHRPDAKSRRNCSLDPLAPLARKVPNPRVQMLGASSDFQDGTPFLFPPVGADFS